MSEIELYQYLEEGVCLDGVCICEATAQPLRYLSLQQLPGIERVRWSWRHTYKEIQTLFSGH